MSGNSSTERKSKKSVKTILCDNSKRERSSRRSRASKKKEYGQNSIKELSITERSTAERTNRVGKFKERNLSKRSNPDKFSLDTLSTSTEEESVKNRGSIKKMKEKSITQGQIGYGKDYQDLIEKHETKFVFPPGSPMDIHVSRSMIVYDLPETMRDSGIDLGDWITAINGESITTRSSYMTKIQKLCEEHQGVFLVVKYQIHRLVRTQEIKDPKRCPSIQQAYDIDPGCKYLFAILSLFPGAYLGLSIKSFSGKIYVSSIDNGFKSLAMRTFLVGDAILLVNGQPVSSVSEADEAIVTGLKSKKLLRCVIERAVSSVSIYNVKQVLRAKRPVEIDPRMMADVIKICEQEITRMNSEQTDEELSSILRDNEKTKSEIPQILTFSDLSAETTIGMDPVNPDLLTKAPPRADLEACRKRRIRKLKNRL